MFSVQAKLVAIRTWPTESASFTASGSFARLRLILVERLLLRRVVGIGFVGRLGDHEGVAAGVDGVVLSPVAMPAGSGCWAVAAGASPHRNMTASNPHTANRPVRLTPV